MSNSARPSLSIGFTGDFCPWGRIAEAQARGEAEALLAPVQSFFAANDLNILDLECPLSEAKQGIIKTGPHLKSPPAGARLLPFLHSKLVVTANNHFKDYGWQGMQDTYAALAAEGVEYLGSGSDLEAASQVHYQEHAAGKLAVVNMTENEWTTTQGAEAGCNPLDLATALRRIQEARAAGADFVVVVLHGGHEHYPLPSPRMQSQFRFMVDAGADAVVGHHTHIISGFELYKQKPIFYSLGNFCFDWPGLRSGSWTKGMLLRLVFEAGKEAPQFEYRLIEQNTAEPGLRFLAPEEAEAQEAEIRRLNGIIADSQALAQAFEDYCARLRPIMLSRIQPYKGKYLTALHKRGFLPDLVGPSKRKMLKILSLCESHREVLLASLNKSF